MYCANCGTEITEGHTFCTNCGRPIPEVRPKSELQTSGAARSSRWPMILLIVAVILVTWLGSAGIAYGVVELTGGGPQGEQGPPGERGPRGLQGSAGTSGDTLESRFALERLAAMFAVVRTGEAGTHPQSQACIDYIMDGESTFVECGFTRAE